MNNLIRILRELGVRGGVTVVLLWLYSLKPPATFLPLLVMLALKYLVGLAGAVSGYWWKLKAIRKRVARLSIFLVLTIGLTVAYHYVTSVPPRPEYVWLFVSIAYTSFFLSCFCFGFCAGEVAWFFGDPADKKSGKSQ